MSAGILSSIDGGVTWTTMGGPPGAMSVSWNPADREELFVVGSNGGARSADGGGTWEQVEVPPGASAVSYSVDGSVIHLGALRGVEAVTYRSTDGGTSWMQSRQRRETEEAP